MSTLIQNVSKRFAAAHYSPQWLKEMEEILSKHGYDPKDAKALADEGMGPEELEGRVKMGPHGVGSLEYTHRLKRKSGGTTEPHDRQHSEPNVASPSEKVEPMKDMSARIASRFKKAVEELEQVDQQGVHKEEQQAAVQVLHTEDDHGVHGGEQQAAITRPTPASTQQHTAVSPPGWEKTVEHMKNHKEIDNPFALAWYMKNKGAEPHHASGLKYVLAAQDAMKRSAAKKR